MEQNPTPAMPSDPPAHTGVDYALIATSAAAGLIALLYLLLL